ncbi:taurine transporter ATP-binding subunit [Enterobacter hormaechei]|nr:taurine transporter ATP-binding subunit [Enterobacter hormaechei]
MLNITNLSADYGGKLALEEINLTLDSGELLVVLGPSGCGKTTLLNLIAGFVPYQHGTIQLEGKRVTGRAQSAAWSFRMKDYSRGETCRKTLRLVCNWPV